MLKKEGKEVLKQGLFFMLIVVVLSVMIKYIVTWFGESLTFSDTFFPVFQVGLLVFSVIMGISLFASDQHDRGMEYLLTLPYSRIQLVMFKVLPRVLAFIASFSLYVFLLHLTVSHGYGGEGESVIPTAPFFLVSISLFIIGFSLSVFWENIVVTTLVTVMVFGGLMVLVHALYPIALISRLGSAGKYYIFPVATVFSNDQSSLTPYLYAVIIVILLGFIVAFFYAFQRFSLKSNRAFTRRFLKILLPVVVVVLAIAMVLAYSSIEIGKNYYYLTSDYKLFEDSEVDMNFYDGDRVTKLEYRDVYLFGALEKNGFLYCMGYDLARMERSMIRTRTQTGEMEFIYSPEDSHYRMGFHFWGYKNTIVFIESLGQPDRTYKRFLVLLDSQTRAVQRMEIPEFQPKRKIFPHINVFGVGEVSGKRFWMLHEFSNSEWTVWRAWESGEVDTLVLSSSFQPVYVNDILIYGNGSEVIFNQFNSEGVLEEVKRLPGTGRIIFDGQETSDLEKPRMKFLYGAVQKGHNYRQWSQFLRLDLETMEMVELKAPAQTCGRFFYRPGEWYYFGYEIEEMAKGPLLKQLYRLHGTQFEPVKTFSGQPINGRDSFLGIFQGGIVLRQGGKTSVFKFPGLEEIVYKGLNE